MHHNGSIFLDQITQFELEFVLRSFLCETSSHGQETFCLPRYFDEILIAQLEKSRIR